MTTAHAHNEEDATMPTNNSKVATVNGIELGY
jgi:hypothetical protein